jgi:alkylation response protein AidB-like acyl-CoA dehydrogenase
MITFSIGDDLALIQSTARELSKREVRPHARDAEARQRVPESLVARHRALGLGTLELPEPLGGLGLGLVGRAIVDEELAFGDLALTLALPAPGVFAQAILTLGTDEQVDRFIPELVALEARGVIAWSEPVARVGGFSTSATELEDGRWRIDGVKTEIVLADEAHLGVVFAHARSRAGVEGPAAFVVPFAALARAGMIELGARTEGLGLDVAPTVDVIFAGSIVDAGSRLAGRDGDFDAAAMEVLARAGIIGAARAVGLARAAFETARHYASERQAFGKPIAHFQGLAFLLADMATRVEVMRAMVYRAVWAFDHAEADATKLAAMAIAECHEGAMFVANHAVQVLGGAGFIQDFPVEKWMRDAKAHMAYALPRACCDLFVGRLAVEGGPTKLEDTPLPGLGAVRI